MSSAPNDTGDGWSDAAKTSDSAAAMAATAKQNLTRCEQEINLIKMALRNLGQATDNEEPNKINVTWIKVEGLPETAVPKLSLQLSSPIETAQLTKIYVSNKDETIDPAAPNEVSGVVVAAETEKTTDDETAPATTTSFIAGEESGEKEITSTEAPSVSVEASSTETTIPSSAVEATAVPVDEVVQEGSVVTFRGVETGQATLVIEATDADIPLGSSTAYDLAPFTSQLLDPMDPNHSKSYAMELSVAILPPNSDETATGVEPVCTVTLKLEYYPSAKDKREELYELLNKASEKKADAVEKFRQSTLAVARARSAAGGDSTVVVSNKKPAVKPGFLNKSSTKDSNKPMKDEETKITKLVAWYDRNLGPNSWLQRYLPIAKNYIIFFGFLTFSHFKGHIFALPPPV